MGPRAVGARPGAGLASPGGGTGAVGEAGTPAGAGAGARRVFGRTPQPVTSRISARSPARLEADAELGTDCLRDPGRDRSADERAGRGRLRVVELQPVEREED